MSKEQKIEVVKQAIKYLQEKRYLFMCSAVVLASHHLYPDRNTSGQLSDINDVLPELAKYKPENPTYPTVWFPEDDVESRVTILNKIIDELEQS